MLLFDQYQYEPSTDLIGKGEFTHVYEALDTHIYLPVAVKIYHAQDRAERTGFVQVEKFMGLDHPNICRYLHIGEIQMEGLSGEMEKSQVCVMELLQDGDFASYYQAHRSPELLRRMVLDILHGLTYLHGQRIVHRRLKPSNLLVGMTTQGPVVKITDFGLGSGKAALRDVRFSSMVVDATRMAPEQINTNEYGINGAVSYHLDFWSLGLTVYEALTDNDTLFMNSPDDSREQLIRNILSPRLPEKLMRLPAPFHRLVTRCLARHAADRPQNTRELIELLAQPISTIHPRYDAQVREPGDPRYDAPVPELGYPDKVDEPEKTDEPIPAVPVPRHKDPVLFDRAPNEASDTDPYKLPARDRRKETRLTKTREAGLATGTTEEVAIVEEVPKKDIHPFFSRYEYSPGASLIGKGGFSRVYKAFDRKLDRWVALKFYKAGEFSERYSPIAEIRRVINLDHPNICRYLDIEEIEKQNVFGEMENTQISVMELLDGGNLLEYYKAHPTEEVLRKLLIDVLHGLAYLHKNGIIHRDIKPANILIRETAEGPIAKITDFGVSRKSGSARTESSAALVVSIPYMAPEQLNVKRYGINEKISFNIDLWALGVTIYEVVTGNILFKNAENDSNEEVMANILAPGLQEKIAGLPEPFRNIVSRCLVKDARQRAREADELIEMLEPKPEPVVIKEYVTVQPPPFIEEDEISEPADDTGMVREMGAGVAKMAEPEPVKSKVTEPEDLFIPELSWTWAEAVAAPILMEPGFPSAETKRPKLFRAKMPMEMRIGAIAGTILVFICFYIITQNHRMSEALNGIPEKTETIGEIIPVSATPATRIAAPRTTVLPEESDPGYDEAEPVASPAKFTAVLSSPKTCSIHINNTPYGVLEGGKAMRVFLGPGDYTIQAATIGNRPIHFTQRVLVQDKNLNHWHRFRIKL